MAFLIEATAWKYDTKYALVDGPIPFLVRDEKKDIVCYGKAERDKIVPLNREESAKAFKLGFITANQTSPKGDVNLYVDIWKYDPTFVKISGSIPFLVRDEKKDIVCYGKADKDKIVPLNEREIAVANGLGLVIWDKPLFSVSRWPRLSEIENKTIIDFSAITIVVNRISFTDDSVLSIVEASLGLSTGSIREDPTVIHNFLDNGWVDPDPSIVAHKSPIIFQRYNEGVLTTWWTSQGKIEVIEERNGKGRLIKRTLNYDESIQYERNYSEDGVLLIGCATIDEQPIGPCYRFSDGTSSVEYMIDGEKSHEKAWNDYITKPIQEGTLLPKELCLLAGAYLF